MPDKILVGQYPAQERVLRTLRARISEGVYPPGSLLPTERYLVDEIGISRPVIRAALQQLVEQGWITREPGHRARIAGTLPDNLSLSDGSAQAAGVTLLEPPRSSLKLKAIASVMPMEPTYPAAYNIQRGIQRTLQRQESDHRLVVFDSLAGGPPYSQNDLGPERESQILQTIAEEGIAGVILWHIGGAETLPALKTLQAAGVPIVFVDRYPDFPDAPPCDFVGVENRVGARDAVNYLIGLGHRRIAHLTLLGRGPDGDSLPVRERFEGYRDALWENGISYDNSLICGSSREILARVKAGGPSAPTAVFAVNDASAHRLIEVATGAGVRVPEDISVIGFDDLDRYSHRSPYLTTMYLPFEAIGERAALLLLQRLKHPPLPGDPIQHTLLSTTLTVRATCREPSRRGDLSELDSDG